METGTNYPFSDAMVFCSRHSKQSDVIDVDKCQECYAAPKSVNDVLAYLPITNFFRKVSLSYALAEVDPFITARPCWLSPLRQIALVEAARELNKRQVS